jgi:hypothetical protein
MVKPIKEDTDHLVKTIKQEEEVKTVVTPVVVTAASSTPSFMFDKNAVLFVLYLLYRKNIIARNNLRELLEEVQKSVPENVAEWLVKESMK